MIFKQGHIYGRGRGGEKAQAASEMKNTIVKDCYF
jgi:hypothetical protein